MLQNKRVLLIISGGIAAYKTLELIRRLRDRGCAVRCVLTEAATQFVTPLSVAALSEEKVYADLFSLTDEAEMGHIRLSREADLVVVAPASADLIARMTAGMANDLAAAVLLASDKPILICPAMNPQMWAHPATQENLATLRRRGVSVLAPGVGAMACGETGAGRLPEAAQILAAIEAALTPPARPLAGRRALVTSGPTREPLDPVRYISNHSSGKQGHAIAAALADLGAEVTLITGPVTIPDPAGSQVVRIETARELLAAVEAALPADILVCAAAVADWRAAAPAEGKIKKEPGAGPPSLALVENPDILATIAQAPPGRRPALVVGFAAETGDVATITALAQAKRRRKGCDWIVANDVRPQTGTFGGDQNSVHLIDQTDAVDSWPQQDKSAVAQKLAARIAAFFHPTDETRA